MKRKSLLTVFLAIAITTVTFAQVSTTPEVPKNYKPQPKELLPMPDSLTDESIFPVLGAFNLADKAGNAAQVTITRDPDNKGIIWVNGLPEGKFKALLKGSPATYKIPAQKTLANDEATDVAMDVADTATAAAKPKSKVVSGRSIQEGTLIYDQDANTLYVNIGNKFNEDNPAIVFPEMNAGTDSTALATTENTTSAEPVKKSKKASKKPVIKSVTYTGSKIDAPTTQPEPAEPASTDSTGTQN